MIYNYIYNIYIYLSRYLQNLLDGWVAHALYMNESIWYDQSMFYFTLSIKYPVEKVWKKYKNSIIIYHGRRQQELRNDVTDFSEIS